MITEEHLEHWLKEIEYQLQGILNEVAEERVNKQKGIQLEKTYVSFEYILEKASTIRQTIHCVRDDMMRDPA